MDIPQLSVSQFLATLNQTLEYAYPVVRIEGEVASYRINRDKFVFFDLKDAEGSVGCFATVWQMRTPLEDGMRVVVVAQPKVTPWGKFSLTVRAVQPVGEGSIKRGNDLLRATLEKEGLFALERKRQLPRIPRRIAVVSSVQAAGYADFMKLLNAQTGGMVIDVADVQVQGEQAPQQIVRAIGHCNTSLDGVEAIVLIRGGGSADDLAAWSDERVVRAIAGSRIPTLVGVGHETDVSLAELAADERASTPSHAAQMIVDGRVAAARRTYQQVHAMTQLTGERIANVRTHMRDTVEQMYDVAYRTVDDGRTQLQHSRQLMRVYDPIHVLRQGYAMIRGDVRPAETITIETAKQYITAEVQNVTEK